MTDLYFSNLPYWGIIPQMLSLHDPRSAEEQLDAGYAHGGGFRPFPGFSLIGLPSTAFRLRYSGDPDTLEVGRCEFRDELIVLFEHEWVAVIQQDLTFVVARMS